MDFSQKVLPLDDLTRELSNHRRYGHQIIFSHGIFDMLHRGHVTLLAQAKRLEGILVVGVENDQNTKLLKGVDRPIHSEQSRLFVVSHLEPVDYVFLIPEYENPEKLDEFYTDLYTKLQADVLATCVEAGRYGPLKKAHAADAGMKFVNFPEAFYERSTTKVIEMLKGKVRGE